jgi:hypothetical protein
MEEMYRGYRYMEVNRGCIQRVETVGGGYIESLCGEGIQSSALYRGGIYGQTYVESVKRGVVEGIKR